MTKLIRKTIGIPKFINNETVQIGAITTNFMARIKATKLLHFRKKGETWRITTEEHKVWDLLEPNEWTRNSLTNCI